MNETLLRLDIWKPASIDKKLFYHHNEQNKAQEVKMPNMCELYTDRIHEQAYSWKVKGDIWTALKNDKNSQDLKNDIISIFSPELPPEQRGFDKLRTILEKLLVFLKNDDNRLWQTWDQLIDDDENINYRIQPILSLYFQLNWLYKVFHNVPGASVTIR